MDEQHDQAVLEIEEIEADADYDYLSILREMQQSLNADENFKDLAGETSEEFDSNFESAFQALPPTSRESGNEPGAVSNLAAPVENDSDEEDYFANAKTQPLPELPADLDNDLVSLNFDAEMLHDLDSNEDLPLELSEDSFASELASLQFNAVESFEDNPVALEFDDHSFDDFAELSPILFDANEQLEIAEPNFEAEFSGTAETMPEMTLEKQSANQSTSSAEMDPDSSSAVLNDEMPTNLAFGEMFAEDSVASIAKSEPQIEIDEEAEAEFTSLLAKLDNEDFTETSRSDQSATSVSEQNFEEQNSTNSLPESPLANSSENIAAKVFESSVNEELANFSLPETMLLGQDKSDLAPEPSFALFEFDQEVKDEMMAEPQEVHELQTKDFADPDFATEPSFSQAEPVVIEQMVSEEKLPETLLTPEAVSDVAENSAAEQRLSVDSIPAAPPESDGLVQPLEFTDEATSSNKAEFDESVAVAGKTDELPETAFFESFNFTHDSPAETNHSDDLSESFLTNPLDDEFEALSAEMPETFLFDHPKTEAPEVELAEFDLPPAVDTNNSQSPELSVSSTYNELSEDFRNGNSLPEVSDAAKPGSFLKERFVIFKLDDTLYAFPAVNVAEIGQLLPITPLPFVPSWFLGISNLRGDILSVVGLRELWEKSTASPHKAKILVVHSEKQALTVGLVVDAVREMRHVAPAEITSDDLNDQSHIAPYQIGMVEYEGQNLRLLNAEKLLESLRS